MHLSFFSKENIKPQNQIDAEAAFTLSEEKRLELSRILLHDFYSRFTNGESAVSVIASLQSMYPDCNVQEILDSVVPKAFRPWQELEYADNRTLH